MHADSTWFQLEYTSPFEYIWMHSDAGLQLSLKWSDKLGTAGPTSLSSSDPFSLTHEPIDLYSCMIS